MATQYKFQTQTRQQVIEQLNVTSISRQIDKMDPYEQIRVVTVEDAKKASKLVCCKRPGPVIHVKTYITRRSGAYGHQFLSCVWVKAGGIYYQASGTKTGGCGYDKYSEAIGSAFNAVGVDNNIGGSGTQLEFIEALAKKLLGNKAFFIVC